MSWTTPAVCALTAFVLGAGGLLATTDVRLPGDHSGYAPEQPIAFSHRLHAGELQMNCQACHYGAERSRHAGIPPAEQCMFCHKHVTAAFDAVLEEREAAEAAGREPRTIVSAELQKLYDALALGDDLMPDPAGTPRPIEWVRVHDLPDYVYFDHRVHVARGLACETCHGPVPSMERVRQDSTLAMGWCMDCHRTSPRQGPDAAGVAAAAGGPHVSIDCARCHY
jgi:hypothetical protein